MTTCKDIVQPDQHRDTIRLLVVDASRCLGTQVKRLIESDPDIVVIGTVFTLPTALAFVRQFSPDVVVFGVENAQPENLHFLTNLANLPSTRLVAVSPAASRDVTLRSRTLSNGAVDYAVLPGRFTRKHSGSNAQRFIQCLRGAAKSKFSQISGTASQITRTTVSTLTLRQWREQLRNAGSIDKSVSSIVAIGASTGGPLTLQQIFRTLTLKHSVAVIAQHMPVHFVAKFAKRLDLSGRVPVSVAQDGAELCPGHCYVAPGNRHLRVLREGSTLVSALDDAPKVCGHRPSVDVLFDSVARVAGQRGIGVILTGMGEDGASGLLNLKQAGGITVAQDEASSSVWGMPGSALRAGATDTALSPEEIAHAISEIA